MKLAWHFQYSIILRASLLIEADSTNRNGMLCSMFPRHVSPPDVTVFAHAAPATAYNFRVGCSALVRYIVASFANAISTYFPAAANEKSCAHEVAFANETALRDLISCPPMIEKMSSSPARYLWSLFLEKEWGWLSRCCPRLGCPATLIPPPYIIAII